MKNKKITCFFISFLCLLLYLSQSHADLKTTKRIWKDSTGKHEMEAWLDAVSIDSVILKKPRKGKISKKPVKFKKLFAEDNDLILRYLVKNNHPSYDQSVTSRASVVENLIQAGANVDKKDVDGLTPMRLSILHNRADIAPILIKKSKDRLENDEGWTLLMLAVRFDCDKEILSALIEAGEDVNHSATNGDSVLFVAIQANSSSEKIEYLIKSGADVNYVGSGGITPLMVAAWYSKKTAVIYNLIKQGAEVNAIAKNGATPLCFAYLSNNQIAFDILKQAGGTLNTESINLIKAKRKRDFANRQTDAEGVVWGDSMELVTVIQKNNGVALQKISPDALAGIIKKGGRNHRIEFNFNNDRLWRVLFWAQFELTDVPGIERHTRYMESILSQKYGDVGDRTISKPNNWRSLKTWNTNRSEILSTGIHDLLNENPHGPNNYYLTYTSNLPEDRKMLQQKQQRSTQQQQQNRQRELDRL